MASFFPAYNLTSKHEGGYVNDPNDAGGETYKGLARRYHGNWEGWPMIDKIKRDTGRIKWNTIFTGPAINTAHSKYAEKKFWKPLNLQGVNSQDLANLIYDTYWGHPSSIFIKEIQRLAGADPDGKIGPQTVKALNNNNNLKRVYQGIKNWRINYNKKSPSWALYGKGWMNRINSFQLGDKAAIGGAGLVIGIVIAAIIANSINNN